MNPKSPEARDEKPFVGMKISDTSILDSLDGRSLCPKCFKSRKYFCYSCYVPIIELDNRIPKLKLPLKIDIIKHRREIEGKSTATHAAVLAPDDVTIHTYPHIPDYSQEDGVVLIFPSVKSSDIRSLFNNNINANYYTEKVLPTLPYGHNLGTMMKRRVLVENERVGNICNVGRLPIKKAVFIDSTWNQSRGIYKDERINRIPSVVIQNRASQFWRHQKGSPRWYLSTVEAIHQFLLEMHLNAWGLDSNYEGPYCEGYRIVEANEADCMFKPYNGQYDDILYFFSHLYGKIHSIYSHDKLLAYQRPMN